MDVARSTLIALVLSATQIAMAQTRDSTNATSGPSAVDLAQEFYRIAVFRETQNEPVGIMKWMNDPTIAIVGAASPSNIRQLEQLLDDLAAHTGLNIRPAKVISGHPAAANDLALFSRFIALSGPFQNIDASLTPKPGRTQIEFVAEDRGVSWFMATNILVAFMTRPIAMQFPWPNHAQWISHRLRHPGAFCFFSLTTIPGTMDLSNALIVVPIDQPEWTVRRCINEEITQSMGLTTDVFNSKLTLFNKAEDPNWTELTDNDRLFLRVLYNREIKTGAKGDQLMQTIYRLIKADREGGKPPSDRR